MNEIYSASGVAIGAVIGLLLVNIFKRKKLNLLEMAGSALMMVLTKIVLDLLIFNR